MRLWHEELLNKLPRQQLLGQHRECAALRGKGWLKPHSTINYIYDYNLSTLYDYHILVMEEMMNRGYNITEEWLDPNYRGKLIGFDYSYEYKDFDYDGYAVYVEHDYVYMMECLENLKNKGINITID